jgi:hypothetical protein
VAGVTAIPKTGKTLSGVDCQPGVRQLANIGSDYAATCVPHVDGLDNGGATYNGVTKDTIKIAIRATSDASGPNATAVNQVAAQAGQLTADQAYAIANELLPWFNKNYELYGRKVQFIKKDMTGNGTDEAQSKGQEAACADANQLASSDHVFGVVGYGFGFVSQPFAECAAQYKLWAPLGAAYFPEKYYQRWDPYVWGTTMECERISHDVAEYVGKRLKGNKAEYAGDPVYQQTVRKFATYVPDNDGYGSCVNIFQSDYKNKYGGDPGTRYNYALDVSQFPTEAERGVIQFKAAGATTLVSACDPISLIFLTQAATKQAWNPEWFLIGVAAQDTDGFGRLYDSTAITGHMFGMSQLGSDAKVNDPNGEAAVAYKQATGKALPSGAGLLYYGMLDVFNMLQAAGPRLTPQTIKAGIQSQPPGGTKAAPVGLWDYHGDHTAINDSREIWWNANGTGYDGKKGTFVETMGGKRFQSGEWPPGEPVVFR